MIPHFNIEALQKSKLIIIKNIKKQKKKTCLNI